MKRLVLAVVVGCVVSLSGIVTAEEGSNGPICLKVVPVSDKLVSDSPGPTGRITAPGFEGEQQLDQRTPFSETVFDVQGQPVIGAHDLLLSYYESGGVEPIWAERIPKVDFTGGRFDVFLGTGEAQTKTVYASLQSVFASHPDLEIEVEVDGVTQAPRVGILPAGHSPETRAMLSGPVSKDELHTKGYKAKSETTSVQAVTLRPSDGKGAGTVDDSATFKTSPFLIDTIHLGTSIPVRDMEPSSRVGVSPSESERKEVNPPRHENVFDEEGFRYGTRTVKIDDPLVKESQGVSGRATPSLTVGFEGIPFTNVTPPDPEGAVGLNHYVQVVNSQFRIYDKTGTPVTTAVDTNSLFSGLPVDSLCEKDNYGDAIFLYDEPADRWVLTQFTSGDAVCFAVSTTDDPTGTFHLYQVNTQKFPDYYKLGVWPDADNNAYFMGTNTGYQGDYDVYALDRENMLTGSATRSSQYFQNHPNLLMPADLDGDNMPPAGQPGIFYTFRDGGESYFIPSSPVDTLDIWEFDVDWNAPANTTFGLVQQITPAEGLADFNWTVCGFFTSDCLPQPGTSFLIDSASWWPMQRLQYRNFGNYEALVSSWTVDTLSSGDHAAPRWFELRRMTPTPSGSWSMAFQGTFSPDDVHRWMPSVALDGSGNMGIAYSAVDGVSVYPSLRYATRAADSVAFDAEAEMVTGLSYYTDDNYHRWGDYSSMEVDPADDCTFWYTGEWIKEGTEWNWTTYVGAFKVPGCTGSTCDADVVTGVSASADGDNQIYLSWNSATDATEYRIYRSQTSGGPYSFVDSVSDPQTNYTDTTVHGSITYFYVVTNYTDCESGLSNEDSTSTTGTCLLPPNFDGIVSVTTPQTVTCTLDLSWNAATALCGGAISYNVYRDTTPGFDPDVVPPLVTGVTGTSYSDSDGLVSHTTYYYVVRAVDSSNSVEDTNTVEDSGVPLGPSADGTFTAGAETGDNMYSSGAWHVSSVRAHSGSNSYNSGYDNSACTYLYPGLLDLTAGQSSVLTYWTAWDIEDRNDGGVVEISTDGSNWTALTPTPGYPNTFRNSADACGYPNTKPCYSGYGGLTFTEYTIDLSAYNGQSVFVVWWFSTNDSVNSGEGWYLDDISITHVSIPTTCTTGGGSCTNPGAVTIDSITDDDACAQDGVSITFFGGSGAASFDLYDNEGLAVTGYTSGSTYDPGDPALHSYVVRAIDASCFTDSGASSFTDGDNTPGTPGAPGVSDDDLCVQDGLTITWGAISGADGYELRFDGGATIYSGPDLSFGFNPGPGSHTYDLRATHLTCGPGAWSGVTTATDEEGSPGTPGSPGVADVSSCALTGVQITWGAVSGATSYDLWVDGTTVVTGVTSGVIYAPGDPSSHNYQVRAVNVCGDGAWSTSTVGTDGDHSFNWAGIETAADRDACDDTGVALRWSIPASWNDGGGSGTRTFTVLRDAGALASGLSEATIGIDDTSGNNGQTYTYAVEAINGYGCSAGGATTLPASDEVGGPPTFGGLSSVVAMPGDICGLRLDWNAGSSNCSTGPTIVYNVYRSETSGFTPDGTTLHDSCVADLFYEDHTVVGDTTYYYVVRAEDSSLGFDGPCGNGREDSNLTEVSGILIGATENRAQATDPLQVTSGSAVADFAPVFTFSTAVAASVGYTLSHGSGAGGTLSYDYGTGTITGGTTTTFTQTVVESETIASVDLNITLMAPNPASSNLLVELVHVNSATSVTVYNGNGNVFPDGAFGPYADFDTLDSASDWQLVVTAAGGNTNGSLAAWNLSIDYAGSGDSTTCTQVELIDPSATATVLKAYTVADTNPYDVTALYTGAGTYQIRLSESCGSQGEISDGAMSVDEAACIVGGADPVQHFAGRSTSGTVKLEWQNPELGAYSTTRVCVDQAAFPTNPATCTLAAPDQAAGLDNYDTMELTGLVNGQTYYYAAFVDNGAGEYSPAQTVTARPFDTTGPTNWVYHTSATALAPPGLYPGAAGTGASYGVSNDRVLHGMNSTTGGGDWPRTAPFDWMPMGMNGPAQSRPPIVPTTVIPGADLVAFLGSQDGHVYAVNAKSGETLWQSASNYGLVQGAPAGIFTRYGGAYDLLFAGSRVAGSGNSMYGINVADGSPAWSFGGTMGIISSGATVDYATNRLYFASRENPGVNENTLWCLHFTYTEPAGPWVVSQVWSQAYGDIDSAPVLFDGVLYVGTNAGVVLAVDPATGARKWKYPTHDGPIKGYVDFEFITGTPRRLFFATTTKVWSLIDDGLTVSVNPDWPSLGVGIDGPSIPLTLADEGAMYVGSTDGSLYQLNPTTGGVVTSVVMGAGTATVGSPGYDWMNSLAYVGAEDGSVYAVTLPLSP